MESTFRSIDHCGRACIVDFSFMHQLSQKQNHSSKQETSKYCETNSQLVLMQRISSDVTQDTTLGEVTFMCRGSEATRMSRQ